MLRILQTNCASEPPPWEDDVHMKPVVADDPWLMFDFQDLDVPLSVSSGSKNSTGSGGFHVKAEDGRVTLSEVYFSEFQETIHLTAHVRDKVSLF